jgi:hypothetical protein
MKRLFWVLLLLLCVTTGVHAESLRDRRIATVDQWADIIRRPTSADDMVQVHALLVRACVLVDKGTDPVRDKNYRWAFQQLERAARGKMNALIGIEKMQEDDAARQRWLWVRITEQSLKLAQQTIRR